MSSIPRRHALIAILGAGSPFLAGCPEVRNPFRDEQYYVRAKIADTEPSDGEVIPASDDRITDVTPIQQAISNAQERDAKRTGTRPPRRLSDGSVEVSHEEYERVQRRIEELPNQTVTLSEDYSQQAIYVESEDLVLILWAEVVYSV